MLKLLKVTPPPSLTDPPPKSPAIAKKLGLAEKSFFFREREKYTFLDRFCELTVRLLSACTLGLHLQNPLVLRERPSRDALQPSANG